MSNLNTFSATGNLTDDPELRYTSNGTPLVRFTVAINNGFGDYRTTTFVSVFGFGKQAEVIAKHFAKGREIGISNAILHQNNWEDKDGNKRSRLEVKLRDRDGFFFTSGGNRGVQSAEEKATVSEEPVAAGSPAESGSDEDTLF